MAQKVNLAEYLKSKREAAGLTQRKVSDTLGFTTPQFVSNWERGMSMPPMEILKKVARMYKVSPDEMFEVLVKETLVQTEVDLRRRFKTAK